MNCGISTACLYPMETEDALSSILALKFHLVEIFFNTFSELKPDYLKKLCEMLNENCCKVKSIHPFTSGFETMLLFSEYRRRFMDGLEFYKRYFETAFRLGAEIFVLHGQKDYEHSKITEEEYFERYEQLYELGKKFGVTVAQENVNAFRAEVPDFVSRMRSYTNDNCAFVFDIKQAVRAGVNPFEMCGAMGERIVHVHLNDNNAQADCLLPGEGTMSFEKLFRQLKDFHYSGDFIIEVYRKNFQSLQQLAAAKSVTETLIAEEF